MCWCLVLCFIDSKYKDQEKRKQVYKVLDNKAQTHSTVSKEQKQKLCLKKQVDGGGGWERSWISRKQIYLFLALRNAGGGDNGF